jgi:hypothetical protein
MSSITLSRKEEVYYTASRRHPSEKRKSQIKFNVEVSQKNTFFFRVNIATSTYYNLQKQAYTFSKVFKLTVGPNQPPVQSVQVDLCHVMLFRPEINHLTVFSA